MVLIIEPPHFIFIEDAVGFQVGKKRTSLCRPFILSSFLHCSALSVTSDPYLGSRKKMAMGYCSFSTML
jgi:hypothetical protein